MKHKLIGEQIGKYVIQELLGQGGMGQIYKAYHPSLERDVAIKLIHIYKAGDPEIVDRFRREAKVVAALRHPGIIQIYDFDADLEYDIFYMVMEFVHGESLAHHLDSLEKQGERMPLEKALRIFCSVTEAVAYAHDQGVIHCDLKPENVMLTSQGLPILTDFGIAKFMRGARLTSTDAILGTPYYMSPEQSTGRGKIDARSDIYALGVMLYELTTGKLPFEGDTYMSIVFKHVNENVPSPREVDPNLPEALEQIIQKAMAKDPDQRFASAHDLLAAIEALNSPSIHQSEPTSLFICYRRHTHPDEELAGYLHKTLTNQGYQVFIDLMTSADEASLKQIDQQIKSSEFFIALLSQEAADSEIIQSEIRQAYEYYQIQGKPHLLSVRITDGAPLPYAIPAFLEPLHYINWQSEADNPGLVEEFLKAMTGQLPQKPVQPQLQVVGEMNIISEDGRVVVHSDTPLAPLPAFDPRSLEELAAPGGALILRDRLYIERIVDIQLKDQMMKRGTTTAIRAPRQTGKTSLLMRGIHLARQQKINVIFMDFQSFGSDLLASQDLFFYELAASICEELDLDEDILAEAWGGARSPAKKLTRLMEQHVLPAFNKPIVLAMDEADSLLQADFYKDFFGLLRSWHNRRASREEWEKLNLVLVISTEPYLLIDDIYQSPFNVGLQLDLSDFDENQVRELNHRHGSPISEDDMPELIALLNGHPYLSRLALYKMVVEGLNWADLRQKAPTDDGPFGDHLRHQYWTIYDKPGLKDALRDVILTQRCPDEVSLFRLLRAGLIKGSGDFYTCRCDLYKLYFEDKLLRES